MPKNPEIPLKKISFLNKKITRDFKELMAVMAKAGIMFVAGKFENTAKELVDIRKAFKVKDDVSNVAYDLVLGALVNATNDIIDENRAKLRSEFSELEKLYDSDDYVELLDEIDSVIEAGDYGISLAHLQNPRTLPLLKEYRKFLGKWLNLFGLSPIEIDPILNRFPSYFVFALHSEWRSNFGYFEQILDKLESPVSDAVRKELEWDSYYAQLEKKVEEPVFDEPFSLSQIFVPLRAYYAIKVKEKDEAGNEVKREKEIAISLEDELDDWIKTTKAKRAIKVISGGPGSGKSSSVKIWASHLAKRRAIKVVFIPLHLMSQEANLIDSVNEYLLKEDSFSEAPLQFLDDEKVLIILDGLDELSKQGKIGETVAKEFVREIERNCLHLNQKKVRLLVLIAGRELVIQSVSSDFKQDKQILHLLPYHLSENAQKKYEPQVIDLALDQRDEWWQKYKSLAGLSHSKMPDFLKTAQLDEITAQPLLNYLVALSVKRGKLSFNDETNLNQIYYDLIEGVHERAYEGREYSTIRGLELDQFIRILEEIAIAAWHSGDVRTTTVDAIEKHIKNSGLDKLFEIFQEGAKSGITRLLTAFYFRETGIDTSGNKTFEFTHKSFGEYLTARRLVNFASKVVQNLNQRQEDIDSGWDERTALYRWLQISGESAIDEYIIDFITSELRLKSGEDVLKLGTSLSSLFSFILAKGFNFGEDRKDNLTEVRISRNAEETLFILIAICRNTIQKIIKIKWPSDYSFSFFLSRIVPVRTSYTKTLVLNHCSYLDISDSLNLNRDLYDANLFSSNLSQATFNYSVFHFADLQKTNLQSARFILASFIDADLRGANLKEANLKDANLKNAILKDAILEDANLTRAILKGANLTRAILKGANLEGANLEGANLKEANLKGANLKEANLKEANLEGIRLYRTDLEVAFYNKQQLKGVDFLDEKKEI